MKSIRKSQSARAGLILPVTKFRNKFKKGPQFSKMRVSAGAGVYTAAVIEYLIAEIIELSGNCCKDNRRARISPRHIMLSVALDEELLKLLKKVVFPGSGVVPNIRPSLFNGLSTSSSNPAVLPAKRPKGLSNSRKNAVAKPKAAKPTLRTNNIDAKIDSLNLTILSEKKLASGQKITVVQADITNISVDAIIHPTNSSFSLSGQVGSTISGKGGQKLRNIVNELYNARGNLQTGGVDVSDASDNMLCKKVIHVNSPSWNVSSQSDCVNQLTQCVTNIFTLSNANGLKTVALPSIGSGSNGFPKQVAAETILRAINSYFRSNSVSKTSVEQVYFVLYDMESVGVYTTELAKLDTSY